jgi:hypothetical protein
MLLCISVRQYHHYASVRIHRLAFLKNFMHAKWPELIKVATLSTRNEQIYHIVLSTLGCSTYTRLMIIFTVVCVALRDIFWSEGCARLRFVARLRNYILELGRATLRCVTWARGMGGKILKLLAYLISLFWHVLDTWAVDSILSAQCRPKLRNKLPTQALV